MPMIPQPVRSSEPELVESVVKFVGGTAAVTKVFGQGVTVTYVSTGIVDLTWGTSPGPGNFVGCVGHCFEATTAADVKGYTVVPGVYNTSTRTLRVNITNASDALADLAALQWLTLKLAFKQTASTV
jgi:hypothetical protein